MYRILPTWGATEAFLPDDADILLENTETGGTLKRHNLKIIDTLFESTACLIANANALNSIKADQIKSFAEMLQNAVRES
jgi:ATP phosphoribosyltransferase